MGNDTRGSTACPNQNTSAIPLVTRIYRDTKTRYLVVGATSFIVDFGLIYVLHELVTFPVWSSTAIAFFASFFFNFFAQKLFSFSSQSSSGWSLAKYTALVIINSIVTVLVVSWASGIIGWEMAKLLVTILTTIWNYWAYKYVVYADKNRNVSKRNKV